MATPAARAARNPSGARVAARVGLDARSRAGSLDDQTGPLMIEFPSVHSRVWPR